MEGPCWPPIARVVSFDLGANVRLEASIRIELRDLVGFDGSGCLGCSSVVARKDQARGGACMRQPRCLPFFFDLTTPHTQHVPPPTFDRQEQASSHTRSHADRSRRGEEEVSDLE
jgi:hypothetical protein